MSDTALTDAIAVAEETITKEIESEEKPEGTIEEEKEGEEGTEGEEEEEKEETAELSPAQLKEAQTLYKALLDPNLRNSIVAALAEQSGLLKNQPLETKKEVAEAKKGIAEIIDEALPEYPGLSKKLGPVIEKIIEGERNERDASMEQIHLQNVENEVKNELDILARETKGESRKVENRMAQLMNEISPGPNVSVKSYIRHLHSLATAGRSSAKVSAEIADKIRRNANHAPDRLKTSPGTARTVEAPTKKMSLNESVNWAIEQAYQNARGKK